MRVHDVRVHGIVILCLSLAAIDPAAGSRVEAVVGEPFGVARIRLAFPAEDRHPPLAQAAVTLAEPAGRVHYLAVTEGIRRPLFGGGLRRSSQLAVMFLFEGQEPFEVTVKTPTPRTIQVVPERRARLAHRNLLRQWWRGYRRCLDSVTEGSHNPPVIQTYLTSMLARRLDLRTSLLGELTGERAMNKGYRVLELLSGAGTARAQITESTSLGEWSIAEAARRPLPDGPDATGPRVPEPEGEVTIESLAKRVPPECFYIRFGQYANFLWLDELLDEFGGELKSILSARGHERRVNERVHDQLAVDQGPLAKLLGAQAIVDVAFIGMDTFLREGAAIGVLFEARGPLLGVDLRRQRQAALSRQKKNGATLKTVTIRGHEVSFLSTPDNQLRSYYLVDDNYHLVTNSRAIVEQFLAVAEGGASLAGTAEFHQARDVLPVTRNHTMFVYFSSAFLRNLLSPHYQIELDRRLRAAAAIELTTLARLAAKGEGRAGGEGLEELVSAGLLPAGFDTPSGTSRPTLHDSHLIDSQRGRHGFFTPVPDMAVDTVSIPELERYRRRARYYAEHPKQVDPILLAVTREDLKNERCERIKMEAFMTPMPGFKYQLPLSLLGDPSPYKLVPPDDNLVLIDAAARGGTLSPNIPPHRLFLCIQDRESLTQSSPEDVLRPLRILRTAPGFLGAWPKPGFLDAIPFVPEDAEGISRIPLGLLRWQGRGFSVLSWDEDLLTEASEQLGFIKEDHAAQVRLRVKDLRQAKFRDWLDQLGYERAYRVSVANARLMSLLHQQLRVPLSECRDVAEKLLDVKLICALEGHYEVARTDNGPLWQSTAWPSSRQNAPPADYATPLVRWFRGLEARVVQHSDRLVVRGHLDIHRETGGTDSKIPFFDLLGGER